jgi:hypothetical protein
MHNPVVSLLQGNSLDVLPRVLADIQEPVTFWLDAHYSGNWGGGADNPILHELHYIFYHWARLSGTVILIDDWRLFKDGTFGSVMDKQVLDAIEKFSIDLKWTVPVSFVDGYQERTKMKFPKDILVVQL